MSCLPQNTLDAARMWCLLRIFLLPRLVLFVVQSEGMKFSTRLVFFLPEKKLKLHIYL